MKLEVLLSVKNLSIKDLDKMKIKNTCTVINQCRKNDFSTYKNFNIYSYDEFGSSNSFNRGLEKVTGDIILLSNNDIVYNDDYETLIIDEFKKNPKADMIIFNISSNNKIKRINRNKRLHLFNSIDYSSQRIAFRRESIKKQKIVFNESFGSNSRYKIGENTIFITDSIKNKLKVYVSCKYIGKTNNNKKIAYDREYLYNQGVLCTAISIRLRKLLMIRFLIQHKEILKDFKFFKAYKIMKKGSISYLEKIYER